MTVFYCRSILLLLISSPFGLRGQGCVAVRNLAPGNAGFNNTPNSWQFSANYRFFHSYRHFIGTAEQKQREDNHTNVINTDNSLVMGANFTLNSKWSFLLAVPLLYIDRSSLYEHYGNNPNTNPRFNTQSYGLGDIRIMSYYTAINTNKLRLQLGIGIKFPTGNYNYKDNFHKRGSQGQDSLVNKVVDQSIQPGDGGLGVPIEYSLRKSLSEQFSLYSNASYLFNPRNTNGILTGPNAGTIPLSNQFSVSDQFFARLGVQYQINNLVMALGVRIEGIPARDLIGKSDGFRRPGYIISAEPSVYYMRGNHTFGLNLPIALVRNRTQSTIDRARETQTGLPVHGDASFADYLISISYAYSFMEAPHNPFEVAKPIK